MQRDEPLIHDPQLAQYCAEYWEDNAIFGEQKTGEPVTCHLCLKN